MTVQAGNLSIWSTLECGLGISAGSLATLRPMFRKVLQLTKDTIGHSSNKGTNNQTANTANTRYNDTKRRSFIQRFSFHNKYQPSGTAKRSSEFQDPEANPRWGFAVPMESISEKPHGMRDEGTYVNVSAMPKAMMRQHGGAGYSHRDWEHQPRDSEDDVTYARDHAAGRSRGGGSPHSSEYSRSGHSREQETWI